jgi:branched-chain amino acid transport system permease protein
VTAPKLLTSYEVGFWLGLNGFVAASIGGFRSPILTVIGGIALGVVVELSIGVDWGPFTSAYKDAIAMTALLLILLARSGRLIEEERTS